MTLTFYMVNTSNCPKDKWWLKLKWYHKTTNNQFPPREYPGKQDLSNSGFTNWSAGRKSVTLVCVCCPDPRWQQARSACMHRTSVQQGQCFLKLPYLLHVGSQPSHLTEGVLDITPVFERCFEKINSFTQKSKMLHSNDFLFVVKSWSTNVILLAIRN